MTCVVCGASIGQGAQVTPLGVVCPLHAVDYHRAALARMRETRPDAAGRRAGPVIVPAAVQTPAGPFLNRGDDGLGDTVIRAGPRRL